MKRNLRMALVALLVAVGCVCVHELGHMLAGVATGGRVSEFVLLSTEPHVRIEGIGSRVDEELRAAGGSALLLFTSFISLLTISARRRVERDVLGVFAIVELAGWALGSILQSPSPNDAEQFMAISGIGASAILPICFVLGIAGWTVLRHRERKRRARAAKLTLYLRPKPLHMEAIPKA